MKWVCVSVLCFIASPTFAEGWEKYGVTQEPTQQELAEDKQYGGYPNSRLFHNETKCRSVLKLFNAPGMGPDHPEMTAFLTYARIKFAEADIIETTINHQPSVFERMAESWSALPAMIPAHCRAHPRDTLENAVWSVYQAAQLSR